MAPDPVETPERVLDCVIVGGGPAGLTAAIYLGRFRRRFALVDAGESRLRIIPRTRNVPGFADGIEGEALHARMREHASRYGALLLDDEVTALARQGEHYSVSTGGAILLARTVLIATGVAVADPPMVKLAPAVAAGLIRYCPICDGFEAQGKKIAVLGRRAASLNEAVFLRTWSENITFLRAHHDLELDAEARGRAADWKIRIEESPVAELERHALGLQVTLVNGQRLMFDTLYPCLGAAPRTGLLAPLGANVSEGGGAITDRHQESSVPGIFAAGDVLEGLDQIASACGQAAVAAVAIHNRLREQERPDGRAVTPPSAQI